MWATTLRPVPALSAYRIVLMTLTDLELRKEFAYQLTTRVRALET